MLNRLNLRTERYVQSPQEAAALASEMLLVVWDTEQEVRDPRQSLYKYAFETCLLFSDLPAKKNKKHFQIYLQKTIAF